jgi:hypothetical protein
MKLHKKYVIGALIMFYEIEMLGEYFQSIINMVDGVENPENVTVHLCWNTQEYLESVDLEKTSKVALLKKFDRLVKNLIEAGLSVIIDYKDNDDTFYNIAQYRRDLNYNYCEKADFIFWGETDSMFPAQGLEIVENVSQYAQSQDIHRYTLTFGYRKNWDSSWDVLTHSMYESTEYVDNPEWTMNNEASSKSYMTMERMNEINNLATEPDVRIIKQPKFDGSCLVISTDLIKSGVLIPHALTHCAEDTSFGEMAKIVLGDEYVQFVVKNILRVHNRRHPRKRNYILGENNPMGLAGASKGAWWDILEKTSKYNLAILRNSQKKFISLGEVINKIKEVR